MGVGGLAHGRGWRWKALTIRILGLGGVHPGLLAVFLAICLMTVGLLVDTPRLIELVRPGATAPSTEEAVTALAPATGTAGEAEGAGSTPTSGGWEDLERRVLREMIDYTIPLIGLDQPPSPAPSGGGLFAQVAGYFLGFVPTDPLSLLTAGVPLFDQVQVAAGEDETGTDETEPVDTGPAQDETPATTTPTVGTNPLILGDRIDVAVYSTHSSESFTSDLVASGQPYQPNAYTGNQSLNVIRVGEELVRTLHDEYGIGAVQIRTAHDSDGYLGAYTRSAATVQALLRDYPDLKLIIDLHRDAAQRKDTVLRFEGRDVARVMIVIGSGSSRLRQPDWQKNYALGRQFAGAIEKIAPGLSRGVVTKPDRYNQQLSPKALLLEVGGDGNSLAEELRTAKLLAAAIAELIGRPAGP